MLRRRMAWGLVVMGMLMLANGAGAKTLYVPAQYSSIQSAINAASKGDEVVVAKGTYPGCIDFKGKAIKVRSANPTNAQVVATTIIHGRGLGTVVRFTSHEKQTSVLSGFTITGGTGSYYDGTGADIADNHRGGGIGCQGASPLLEHLIITGNSATGFGAGAYFSSSSSRLEDVVIQENSATTEGGGTGGGLSCYRSSLSLVNVTIENNDAYSTGYYLNLGYGGGMDCSGGSTLTLSGTTIRGNTSDVGGGVYCTSSSIVATECSIDQNHTTTRGNGGGILCYDSSLSLTDTTISSNSTTNSGGGILCDSCSPSLTSVLVSNNHAHKGGGIYCDLANPQLLNATLSGNSATYGGAIYCCEYSQPVLTNTIVAQNTNGYGLYCDNTDGTNFPKITFSDFYNNYGGDFYGFSNPTGKNGNKSKAPLFANAAKGDYHLKSQAGRWNGSAWVTDTVTSPCIDAGRPASSYNAEPSPNGGRINMGYDGNTAYASKSPASGPAPQVTAWTPKGTSVATNNSISLTFSTRMDPATVQEALTINDMQATAFGGTFTWTGNKVTFTPTDPLAADTSYTVELAATAKSATWVPLAEAFSWTFKTRPAPVVKVWTPRGNTVYTNSSLSLTFNIAMDQDTVQSALTINGVQAPAFGGAFTWVGNRVIFKPSNKLQASTPYTVALATTAQSARGVPLAETFTWTFTTRAAGAPALTLAAAPTASGAQLTLNLASAADVSVSVRNLAGREVAALSPGLLEAGVRTVLWNGRSQTGTKVPAGTYLVTVMANGTDGASAKAVAALQLR